MTNDHAIPATNETAVSENPHGPHAGWAEAAARIEADDAPELTDDWFDKADLMIGDTVIRRDRPPGTIPHRRRFTIGYTVEGDTIVVLGVIGRGQQLGALVTRLADARTASKDRGIDSENG